MARTDRSGRQPIGRSEGASQSRPGHLLARLAHPTRRRPLRRRCVLTVDASLTASDAHTARHIFDQCLKGPLVKGRTIVLVSHHVQLCAPGSDFVCLLDSGYVKYSGPASDFLGSQDFRDLLGLGAEPDEPDVAQNADAPKPKAVNKTLARLGGGGGGGGVVANGSRTSSVSSMDSSASEGESETEDEESSSDEDDDHAPRKLIEDEARATGQVSWAVWRLYLGSNGHLIFWSLFAGASAVRQRR